MHCYITRPLFFLILFLIFLLPLSKKAGLLLFGERTTGTVTGYGMLKGNSRNEKFPGINNISIISYTSNGENYSTSGPLNVFYDLGETVTIIYKKDNPEDFTLLTFTSLYSGYGLILSGFIMMIWMAFYLTFCSRKLKVTGYKPKPGNWKQLE